MAKSTGLPFNNLYPYAQFADVNGNYLPVPYQYRQAFLDTAGAGQLLDWQYRPLEEIRLTNNVTTTNFIKLNLGCIVQNFIMVDS